jgi:hypothetical protein
MVKGGGPKLAARVYINNKYLCTYTRKYFFYVPTYVSIYNNLRQNQPPQIINLCDRCLATFPFSLQAGRCRTSNHSPPSTNDPLTAAPAQHHKSFQIASVPLYGH